MINSIVVVRLLPKLRSSKLSNRAIAGDILISNLAKSISVKSIVIVEYIYHSIVCGDWLLQHGLDEITNFSIIGRVVIEFDCNASNVDFVGVMQSIFMVVLVVVLMLEILGLFMATKWMIIMLMLEKDKFLFVLFAIVEAVVIGVQLL